MAIRKVLLEGDETLRKKSKQVLVFDQKLEELLKDMEETMHKHDGAGLAGPQVGVLKRVFVMLNKNKKVDYVINPTIISQSGKNKYLLEGCLSLPQVCGEVERPNEVVVEYQDLSGNKVQKTYTGFQAKTFCHEFDHLDGILYSDKAKKMYDSYDEYFALKDKNKKENKN